ncbi:MAG: DUF1566 domain-containing protein [Pseudomonadota bacterium]
MPMVFLSYRRDDSRADAGRLYDHLSRAFGEDAVFMDVDDIAPGENFVARLETTLARCDVLLAVIGRRWTTVSDAGGTPRLHDADDYVALEIATALKRGVTVIPVLVGGATMPASGDLPPTLAALGQQQALSVRDERFRDDVEHLVDAVRRSQPAVRRRRALSVRLALAGAALALVLALGWWGLATPDREPLRATPEVLTLEEARAMILDRDFYTPVSNPASTGGAHDYRNELIDGTAVVIDARTGLMWQRSAFSPQTARAPTLAQLEATNRDGLAGFHDWRLPTLEEATSLLSPEAHRGFHLDPAFDGPAAPAMWTADTTPDGRPWIVWPADAAVVPESPGFNAWLRLVRTHR